MKRLLSCLLLLMLAAGARAQTDREIRALLETRNATAFLKYVAKYEDDPALNTHLYLLQQRELAPSYQEAVALFEDDLIEEAPDGRHLRSLGYSIHLITASNAIIYYSLQEGKYKHLPDSTLQPNYYADSMAIKKLCKKFEAIFTVALDPSQLFQNGEEDHGSYSYYASSCGPAYAPPERRDTMENIIRKGDRKRAFSLITNTNSETQLYGVEAYYRLRRTWKLTSTERRIIRYITHKKGSVQTCYGCMVGERLPIMKACRKFNFGW